MVDPYHPHQPHHHQRHQRDQLRLRLLYVEQLDSQRLQLQQLQDRQPEQLLSQQLQELQEQLHSEQLQVLQDQLQELQQEQLQALQFRLQPEQLQRWPPGYHLREPNHQQQLQQQPEDLSLLPFSNDAHIPSFHLSPDHPMPAAAAQASFSGLHHQHHQLQPPSTGGFGVGRAMPAAASFPGLYQQHHQMQQQEEEEDPNHPLPAVAEAFPSRLHQQQLELQQQQLARRGGVGIGRAAPADSFSAHLHQKHQVQAPQPQPARAGGFGIGRAAPADSFTAILHQQHQLQPQPWQPARAAGVGVGTAAAAPSCSLHPQHHQPQPPSAGRFGAARAMPAAASFSGLHHQHHQMQPPQPKPARVSGVRSGKPAAERNPVAVEMALQDALKVCNPDIDRPFSSVEDAVHRLLPYHIVSDYEAEEDDRILDTDTTGHVPSRLHQWNLDVYKIINNFTDTFENQVRLFNTRTRQRELGESRSEERLMIEHALLQEEKQSLLEFRREIESRATTGQEAAEAKMRMAMVQSDQAQARAHGLGQEQEQGWNMEEIQGQGNAQRDKGSSSVLLNDENELEN